MDIDKYLNREDEWDPERLVVERVTELMSTIDELHKTLHSRPLLTEKDGKLVVDKKLLKEMKEYVNSITYDYPYVNRAVKEL